MSTPAESTRNWQSVRTVLEGLILIALVWSARALTATQTQLAVVQVDLAHLRSQLAGVPDLDKRMARTEIELARLQQVVADLRAHRREE